MWKAQWGTQALCYGNKQPQTTNTNPSSHSRCVSNPPHSCRTLWKCSPVNQPHLTFPLPSVLWFRKQTGMFWFPECKLTFKPGFISKSAGPPAPINFPISHFVHILPWLSPGPPADIGRNTSWWEGKAQLPLRSHWPWEIFGLQPKGKMI